MGWIIGIILIVIGMNIVDYSHIDMLRHPDKPFTEEKRSKLIKVGLIFIFLGIIAIGTILI